ncbi:MAG: hypothetical protein U9M92_01965 [Patescibacteria group bacterium]|nr:hypothetical protein [Patescibacteria group bacterium]
MTIRGDVEIKFFDALGNPTDRNANLVLHLRRQGLNGDPNGADQGAITHENSD